MKIGKRILSIIFIFLIIQIMSMTFVSHKIYAESFFEKVFKSGKEWENVASNNAESVDITEITDVTQDIYNAVRAIGVGIFMVDIAFTAVAISNKNNGKDIAGAKMTIYTTIILAALFIFAQPIIEGIQKFLTDLKGTM